MPWVRIDENAIDHPKFIALSANAWRLWCEGQSYCQKHLTDGLIPRQVLKGFRYYSPTSLKMLTSVLVPGKAELWHQTEAGVQVHDYLDWNDSRETVLRARNEAKDRRRRWRDQHASMNASPNAARDASPNAELPTNARANVVRGVVCSDLPGSPKLGEGGSGETTRHRPREVAPGDNPDLSERAGRFLERYAELYERHRRGAKYLGKPVLDFQEALQLVRTWEDARLDQLATVFLTTDHEFAEKGSRTVAQFRSMASWCDSRLAEAGL